MGKKKDNVSMGYPFKRNFYYEIEKAMEKSNVVFLLGPRKYSKNVALLQLQECLIKDY